MAMDGNKFLREILGLFLIFSGLFLLVSLVSFDPRDPTINQAVNPSIGVHNHAGLVGSFAAGLFLDVLGLTSFLLPPLCLYLGGVCFVRRYLPAWWQGMGLLLAAVAGTVGLSSPLGMQQVHIGGLRGGGLVGQELFRWSAFLFRDWGAFIIWTFAFLVGLQLTFRISWIACGEGLHRNLARIGGVGLADGASRLAGSVRDAFLRLPRPALPRINIRRDDPEPEAAEDGAEILAFDRLFKPQEAEEESGPAAAGLPPKPKRAQKNAARAVHHSGELPSPELLDPVPANMPKPDMNALKAKAEALTASLADFGIEAQVERIAPGPVVTMFELRPAPGVKLSRIMGLSDDLTMALKAMAVRIEPIPGKDLVGVEIPNQERETVYLREVLSAPVFAGAKGALPLALGKDIQGTPYVADLAKMPHLLVAGATGAGKSVCLNTILLSLVAKSSPEQLKLLLVDPKRIELSVYGKLPHLVHPVVTDMALAKSALEWAVNEMERCYDAMASLGVRNLDDYNAKLAHLDPDELDEMGGQLSPMPYLVIIIDELADLMMTAAKEAETSIVRLAQLARAAGIHLILATQRPSVDVVTGLIKANFPTRISFQVTSKHDSRTILDTVGAEHLLGRGDMLYKPSGGRFLRLHGAYVGEGEIDRYVDFWRERLPQDFDLDLTAWAQDEAGAPEGTPGGMDNDPLYNEAVDFVLEQGKASISLIQRRFRIGFNRAARFIEQMEVDGMLGPQEGAKPRTVLRGKD